MVVKCGEVERSFLLVAIGSKVSPLFNEILSRLAVADVGRMVQGRPPVRVDVVYICVTVHNNCLQSLGLVAVCG